ncbi:glycoside hydrolase family 79 protein [Gelatoporia subvermispora B]|uniref:Glycoside hydrolase family 79 protein n=1 Tax=Ceriporiopsis subvermispora (strain B) TaxID=914234 RepID=M2R8E2_CERS8|nr:glycoside hydrolase family 79 protein [Gelatoporia subvermispora B]
MLPFQLLLLGAALSPAHAITVYGVQGVLQGAPTAGVTASATITSDTAAGTAVNDPGNYTGDAAFNPVILAAPPIPSPAPPTQFTVQLPNNAQNQPGLSIQQDGSFLGFSIEMSVVTQVIGINSTFLQVPFLNLMALVAERGGSVHIRVGGNTQETATVVPSLPDGKMIEKDKGDSTNPTQTPALLLTPELMYMMNNVSALINVKWYLGIPFNDTSNLRLQIAEYGEAILGDNILGFQLGNEPDLYVNHDHRPPGWNETNYFEEFGLVINAIGQDSNIPVKNTLIAPSVSGTWSPEDVWDTGFIPAYQNSLGALAVEHYPDDNCAAAFPDAGFGAPKDPQTVFPEYLNHNAGKDIVGAYIDSTNIAQQYGKPFLMFETNTASCGGFPGISDSFGSALWGIDYALQMAYANFTGALMHVGGVDDSYNPFTAPPTNMSQFEQWTIGPIFYANLVVAEALGTSGTSQVLDLNMNEGNIYTPGYGIWENGQLARLVLINFMTDPTGANSYTTTIQVGGVDGEANATPASVRVKMLAAESVAVKENITWAGQTLGNRFAADGRLSGDEEIQTITCDQTQNTCQVTVPAPGVAVVFLTDEAFAESEPSTTQTFATTALTKTMNTATVPASVLATSNGNSGADRDSLTSTSKGSSGAGRAAVGAPGIASLIALLAGMYVFASAVRR